MSAFAKPVKVVAGLALALWMAVALLILRGYIWPLLSSGETPVLMHLLDPTLFAHDFTVQEWLRFNPRFYYNELIVAVVHWGLTLPHAMLALHVLALASFVTALHSIARSLSLGAVAEAFLIIWTFNVGVGAIGGVFIYTHAPVPAVWAMAAATWGLALVLRGKITAGYACFGGAALLQFLVGFYAGLLMLPCLLAARIASGSSVKRPDWRQIILGLTAWAAGLAAVAGPMMWRGGTASGAMPAREFVELYAFIRHPHHLVPSTWGWPAWAQFIAFYAGAMLCVRSVPGRSIPHVRWWVLGAVLLAAAALVVNLLFVEFWHSAWIAKLQPARATPFAELVVLAILAQRVQRFFARGDWFAGGLLGLIPLTPLPGFLLLVGALLLPTEGAEASRGRLLRPALLAVMLVASVVWLTDLHAATSLYLVWSLTFAVAFLAARGGNDFAGRRAIATVLFAVVTVVMWLVLPPSVQRTLAPRFRPDSGPVDPPSLLGRRFREYAPKDSVVLVPPDGDSWSFKLFAQRAVVVETKTMPFTDRGMLRWKSRLEDVLGEPLRPGLDLQGRWHELPVAALTAAAARNDAGYLLTEDAFHPAIPGAIRVDQVDGWSVWKLAR